MSRGFVDRWAEAVPATVVQDHRGWPRGQPRRWDAPVVDRVGRLHAALRHDPRAFFIGATAIAQAYRRRYPQCPVPSLRTIGRMLRALGVSAPRQRGRHAGAAAALGYPTQTLAALGPRLMELDCIGPKYLAGSSTPLTFAGFSCARPPRLRYFARIPGPTADALMAACADCFYQLERPALLKVDNAPATIGSGSAPRTLSRFVRWLLAQEIEPVFAVPRQPFSQASIEGNNSVFARKFWRSRTFASVRHVDQQLRWFNRASLTYTDYRVLPGPDHAFTPQVHFLRQVRDAEDGRHAGIDILNTFVPLRRHYTQLFVLATWHLPTERLHIYLERDGRPARLTSVPFAVNPTPRSQP